MLLCCRVQAFLCYYERCANAEGGAYGEDEAYVLVFYHGGEDFSVVGSSGGRRVGEV